MAGDPFSDARLEAVLTSVGDHLVVPPPVPWEASAGGRARRRAPVPAVAVAASVLLVVGVATVVAPVRDAAAQVGDWLGIGHTRIEQKASPDTDPSGLPSVESGLEAISPGEAEARLGRPLPTVAGDGLGEPDLVAAMPEGGVLLGWDEAATTLWVRTTADPADTRVSKVVDELAQAERVPGLGESAVFIGDAHVMVTPHRRVAAGAVLLWIDAGVEYRLESDLPYDAMLAAARSVSPTKT